MSTIVKNTCLTVLLVVMALAAGCAGVPFRQHEEVSMDGVDAVEMVESYSAELPENLNLLSSLVFRYTFIGKISALGTIEADIKGRRFSAVGMSPMGVKLFSVKADHGAIMDSFVIRPLSEKGDLASAVAADIWRMYFDLAPSGDARVRRNQSSIEFIEPFGDGYLVRVFAGPGGNLVMKKFYSRGVLRWKVGYYEYIREGGRLYPGGMVLTDLMSGYELTARIKKIYDEKD